MVIPDPALFKWKMFLAQDAGNDHGTVLVSGLVDFGLRGNGYCDLVSRNQIPDKTK